MDKPTIIESLRYRCDERGESWQEFVSEYCSRDELLKAAVSDDKHERRIALRLLKLQDELALLGWDLVVVESETAPERK